MFGSLRLISSPASSKFITFSTTTETINNADYQSQDKFRSGQRLGPSSALTASA